MSELENLIQRLCPDGVEYKTMEELGSFYGGLFGKTRDDFKDGNAKFITYKNIYSNIALNIEVEDRVRVEEGENQNTIQYGDVLFTGSSETPDECGFSSVLTIRTEEKLYLNSFCFGFRLYDKTLFLLDFMKYLFRSQQLRNEIGKTASGVTRFNVSKKKMAKITIPVPPIEVQREIVRILDNFTELIDSLKIELALRNKQCEYYQEKLIAEQEVERLKICDVCSLSVGGDMPKERFSKELTSQYSVPIYSNGVGESALYGYTDMPKIKEPCVTIAARGTIGYCEYRDEHFYPIIRLICAVPKKAVIAKYLKYAIRLIKFQVPETGIPQLTIPMLSRYTIPVPPLREQERIVAILDKFDALCNDLTQGLPAEIEARKKQYEYYRDKLLTFKEKTA